MNIFITQLAENPRYFFLVTLAVIPSICLRMNIFMRRSPSGAATTRRRGTDISRSIH